MCKITITVDLDSACPTDPRRMISIVDPSGATLEAQPDPPHPKALPKPAADYERAVSRALDAVTRQFSRIEQEREAAPGLLDRLLTLRPQKWLEEIERDERLRSPSVCRELLGRLEALVWQGKPRFWEACRLARILAGVVPRDPLHPKLRADLRAHSGALLGGALLDRNLSPAEARWSVRDARRVVAKGSGDPAVEGAVVIAEAKLAYAEGQKEEACRRFHLATALYRRAQDREQEGLTHLSLGILYRELGDKAMAFRAFEDAARLLDLTDLTHEDLLAMADLLDRWLEVHDDGEPS